MLGGFKQLMLGLPTRDLRREGAEYLGSVAILGRLARAERIHNSFVRWSLSPTSTYKLSFSTRLRFK